MRILAFSLESISLKHLFTREELLTGELEPSPTQEKAGSPVAFAIVGGEECQEVPLLRMLLCSLTCCSTLLDTDFRLSIGKLSTHCGGSKRNRFGNRFDRGPKECLGISRINGIDIIQYFTKPSIIRVFSPLA